MIKHPYGDKDPYAVVELISSTQLTDSEYTPDQLPVLAARVSHAGSGKTGDSEANDIKLMNFLADHKHMTPFEHQYVTFRIVAPIFVFREWHRHRTQAFNEVSMRYSSNPVGNLYHPSEWRMQANRDKQSSAGILNPILSETADEILKHSYDTSIDSYNKFIGLGVCREQARIVVPVGNYSEMYASANLRNWFGFWLLRSDPHAQKEIRDYSDAIGNILEGLYPNSWRALSENRNEN